MQQNVTDLLSFFPKLSVNAYIIMEKKKGWQQQAIFCYYKAFTCWLIYAKPAFKMLPLQAVSKLN